MIAAQLHGVVHILRLAAFHNHEGRLVLHGNQNPVYHEARELRRVYSGLADDVCKFLHNRIGLIRSHKSPYQFQQLHNRRRIEEMRSHHLVRAVGDRRNLGDA